MEATMRADEWNEKYPVGTRVKYYPTKGSDWFRETFTRSTAWELGHGAAVVKISGQAGGVSLDHLEVVS